MRRCHPCRGRGAAGLAPPLLLLLPVVLLLQGCAALWAAAAVAGGVSIAANPEQTPLPKSETNRATLPYPIDTVYATLRRSVERNGRTLVEAIDASHTLRVAYPFSLLSNNWGGVITVSCIAQGEATTVVILGSGRDTDKRLRKIGDEIIDDLRAALASQSAAP